MMNIIYYKCIYLFVQMTILSQRITTIARHIALGQLRENQEEKASEEDRDTE